MYKELLSKLYNESISIDDRCDAIIEEYEDVDKGDICIHEQLIDLVCRFDNCFALTAADLIGECFGFSGIEDMDIINEIQRAVVSHKSHLVRMELLSSLEVIFIAGLDDESCWYMKEDGILDTTKYLGHPEDFADCLTLREKQRRIKKYDLFISYASEQRESILRPLVNNLKTLGISLWVDIYGGILAGQGLRQELLAAIDHAKYICIIVSKEYLQKRWTIREFNEIFHDSIESRNLPLIPLIYDIPENNILNLKDELIKNGKIWSDEDDILSISPSESDYKITNYKFNKLAKIPFYEIKQNNIDQIANGIASYINKNKFNDPNLNEFNDESNEVKNLSDKNDLFLSYSSCQDLIIKKLVEKFNSKGITVWEGDSEKNITDDERINVFHILDYSNCFCVFISHEYLKNSKLLEELEEMRRLSQFVNFPVLPILYDISVEEAIDIIKESGSFDDELKNWLTNIMCLDMTDSKFDEIVNEIDIFSKRTLTRFCLKP